MRTAAFALAVLGILAAASPAIAQDTVKVALREVQDRKAVFATVESVDVARARARIGGTVRRLSVDEGDAVVKGAAIAEIRDPKLPLQVASVDARIRSLAAQLDQARTRLKRIDRLRDTGTASQSQLDDARTALDVVTAQLAAAGADREVLRERQAEGQVRAPDSGRVLRTHLVEGEVVMPGEPVATIAVERYVLRLRLPERHARFLRAGDEVLVGERGLADRPQAARAGTVRKVYPELSGGRVVADVDVPGLGDYFVGERARVWVSTGTRPAMVVPVAFLATRSGVDYARVRGPGGEAVDVVVQVGREQVLESGRTGAEVLSGLRPGDVLVRP